MISDGTSGTNLPLALTSTMPLTGSALTDWLGTGGGGGAGVAVGVGVGVGVACCGTVTVNARWVTCELPAASVERTKNT